jgi:DNA-binding CsgD family transcriptional regulator/tetratricopeptide (TPR) repeat protein
MATAHGAESAAPGPALLERGHQVAALREAHRRAVAGRGVLVLLAGEAGGGKTALVRHAVAEISATGTRILWGGCDPLFAPRPLGPFLDMALPGDAGAKPHLVAAALGRQPRGTVIVVEDVHWADEATLDVLSLLGRRIDAVPVLVVATYRGEEIDRGHPFRQLLGELRTGASIRRLTAEPLSLSAVAELARAHGADQPGIDAAALHRTTSGNPFFVTEVLAAGGASVPATVRDAVLARAARLGPAAMAVLETVSICVPQAELPLLDALATDGGALERCLDAGMLIAGPAAVAFRHDLARLTIEESLPPHRRRDLHRRVLRALRGSGGEPDPARFAHHAAAGGDADAVLEFAPAAAERAAASGAQREAAALYAQALRFADGLPQSARAALLEKRSYACYLTDLADASIDALREAVECWRADGDERRLGAALSQLSRRLWCGGQSAEAARAGQEALAILERLPAGTELALAYSNLAQIALNDERRDETLWWSERALALAERAGDPAVVTHSLNNIGTIRLLAGDQTGMDAMRRSLDVAEREGLEEHVGRAYIHVGWAMTRTRAYQHAAWLDRGLRVCEDLGLERWGRYVLAYRARTSLDHGCFDDAASDAAEVLRSSGSVPLLGILALTTLALTRLRRGDPGHEALLDAAVRCCAGQTEVQYLAPIAAARAEAAWLTGNPHLVDAATRDTLDEAAKRESAWVVGELAWLRRLAGIEESVPSAAEPYLSQLAGDVDRAAALWTDLGCPYDAALALVGSPDEDRLRVALAGFQRLGARAAAAVVARRLRANGARAVPRGPRPSTLNNPARLTPREVEVLSLIREGLSNAEIAVRLYLAEKTVHHHVSAVLRKLGVATRGQAAREAARRGLPG